MVLTLAKWKLLSEDERSRIIDSWNPYAGEGESLLREIAQELEKVLGDTTIDVEGPAVQQGGIWVIDLSHPFVFDRRKLPSSFLGVFVHPRYRGDLPAEFRDGKYAWAPSNYELFVDNNLDSIRKELGDTGMSREEILSALVGRPFSDWVKFCEERNLLK